MLAKLFERLFGGKRDLIPLDVIGLALPRDTDMRVTHSKYKGESPWQVAFVFHDPQSSVVTNVIVGFGRDLREAANDAYARWKQRTE